MIKFKDFLLERFITSDKEDVKSKYHDDIHHMLKHSYKDIGGYKSLGHGTKEESDEISKDIHDPNHVVKISKSDGKPVAVALYRKQHGRKRISVGTDGTDVGKKHIRKIMQEDHDKKRAWSETSGVMTHISRKMGVPEIPNARAEELTGKKVKLNPDNTYVRDIGGHPHEKLLMGHTGKEWK